VVYVPVQYDGQSGANVWSMYRYSMMVSLQDQAVTLARNSYSQTVRQEQYLPDFKTMSRQNA
jgi:hypothetical protein